MKNNSAIILLLISFGLFYTFTNDQYKEAKELSAIASQYQDVLRNASAIVELRDQLLVAYKSLPPAEVERITRMLPDNIDTVRMALDLDGLASKYGVTIKGIQATTNASDSVDSIGGAADNPYGRATITFSFVANYEDFSQMMADLERNLRVMDIKNLNFSVTESGLYEYQLAVDTYWIK